MVKYLSTYRMFNTSHHIDIKTLAAFTLNFISEKLPDFGLRASQMIRIQIEDLKWRLNY